MTSTGTPTTAPQALTTPFVPPEDCIDQFTATSYITSFSWGEYSTTTLRVLLSEAADSCLPSGWDVPASEFQPSPAVCPSDWTAYNLGGTAGFTLSYLYGIPIAESAANACFEPITIPTATNATSSPGSTSTASTITPTNPFPHGLRVHNAWHITWEASDVPSLSPSPPDLGSCTTLALATWVPGTPVDAESLACGTTNDGASHSSNSDTALFRFLVIGIPVIAVVVLGVGAVVFWRRRRRRKGEEQYQRTGGGGGQVTSIVSEGSR
ncbi:hypothetical protein BJX65DRAFT_314816 [Aspergillus insuetus]